MDEGKRSNRLRLADIPVGSRIIDATLLFATESYPVVVDRNPFDLPAKAIEVRYEAPDGTIHHRISDPETGALLHTCARPGPRSSVSRPQQIPHDDSSSWPDLTHISEASESQHSFNAIFRAMLDNITLPNNGPDDPSSWLKSFPSDPPPDPQRN